MRTAVAPAASAARARPGAAPQHSKGRSTLPRRLAAAAKDDAVRCQLRLTRGFCSGSRCATDSYVQKQVASLLSPQRSTLQAQDFRHPLDETNTQLLQMVPALPGLTKALLGTKAEARP